MMLAPTFTQRFLHVVYELNDEFYQAGMDKSTCHDCDAWWNISWI